MTDNDPDTLPQFSGLRLAFEVYDRWVGHIDRVARWVIGLAIFGIFVLLVLQVLVRYVLPVPFPWVEEAAVYLSAYVALIGASVCLRAGFHLQVDLLPDLLGRGAKVVLLVFQQALMVTFALFVIRYGWAFVELGQGQTSPSTYFYVSHARLAMPIGGVLLLVQSIAVTGRAIADYFDKNRLDEPPHGGIQAADT